MSSFKVQGNASGAGTFTLQSPNIAGNLTLTAPAADGTNGQAMVTNGSGQLSFATVTSPPGGSSNQVQYNSGGAFAGSANLTFDGTTLAVANRGIAKAGMPAGSVLQVVQATKTDLFTTTSSSWVDITGLSATITPTLSTSKILIMVSVAMGTWTSGAGARLFRGATAIFDSTIGSGTNMTLSGATGYAAVDNRTMLLSQTTAYLDSPATTSPTTYKMQGKSDGTQTLFVNQSYNGTNNQVSQILLMEIAA